MINQVITINGGKVLEHHATFMEFIIYGKKCRCVYRIEQFQIFDMRASSDFAKDINMHYVICRDR